jgi:hypothetical protein
MLKATVDGFPQWGNSMAWGFLVLVVITALLQQHFMAIGLSLFDALFIIPIFQVRRS